MATNNMPKHVILGILFHRIMQKQAVLPLQEMKEASNIVVFAHHVKFNEFLNGKKNKPRVY